MKLMVMHKHDKNTEAGKPPPRYLILLMVAEELEIDIRPI